MKLHRSIAAGTALALLMAAPVSAAPAVPRVPGASETMNARQPVILAQASIEDLRRRLEEEELTDEERAAIEQQIQALENAAPAEEAPAEEAPAEEAAPEQPAAEEPAAEAAPVEEPAAEEPVVEEEPTDEPAAEEAPAEEPAAEEAPAEEAPAEEPAAEEPVAEEPAEEEPAAEEAPAEEPAAEEQSAEEPADGDSAEAPESEDAAPVLDSQKEAEVSGEADAEAAPEDEASAAPPPESDAAAQASAAPAEVESATAAEGTRVEESEARNRRERHSDAEVIAEIAGRVILSLAGRQVVEHDDRDRLRRGATEVYYEDLRRGRTRETIVRRNGSRIVTIRDRYGDIIRRSRITPDGREYVLVYAGDRDGDDDGRRNRWRDPGRDLPPLRLRIPVREYILDADRVDDPDRYYEFLDQPPVEQVRRLYSVDEVKYSARIRDTVRRVDLDNITFEFGSADISESEIAKLEGVANAMTRLLDENPAETFLIEGHTDAVGTDTANLSLSDRRAETVARALTDVFEIPPENLVTQGYGEAYLKVNTEEPNRTNRRVAVRRITPLVTVASQ
jgi:outer membrane protein OmpA-like peptidoglycan-associated protein